jgi:ornithine cyclodeaminase/alanine dehydrogenase-like protein (mu-crystallin family)
MASYSRREFLETSSAAVVGAGVAPYVQSRPDGVPPSDQLRFGVIGCNGMGWTNMNAHQRIAGVECVALCDVDRNVLEKRAGELEEQTGQQPTLYDDYRRLLEDDDVDFVIIATPDHWHCLPMVEACQAGKDVYVEKPLGNSIGECLVMQQAAAQRWSPSSRLPIRSRPTASITISGSAPRPSDRSTPIGSTSTSAGSGTTPAGS